MILKGGNPDRILSEALQTVSVNIAQLIRFNCVKKKRREGITELRHSKNEPPLPVIIGLMVHVKTGKQKLVEELSSQGVCIRKQVREMRRSISNQVCRKYNSVFVCPSKLQYNLFTISAIDNVEHNPTLFTSFLEQQYLYFSMPMFQLSQRC